MSKTELNSQEYSKILVSYIKAHFFTLCAVGDILFPLLFNTIICIFNDGILPLGEYSIYIR